MGVGGTPGVRVGTPSGDAELADLRALLNRTYQTSAEDGEAWLKRVSHEDLRVVRRGGRVAGGLLLLPMGQWFGGRNVPMTGIASVGIDPEHRAAGLGTALMHATLEELHAKGAALSALYPSTVPLYRRAGWELAGTWTLWKLPCNSIDVRDRELDLRRLEPADAATTLRPLYDAKAQRSSGHLDRTPTRWDVALESDRGQPQVYVVGAPGNEQGYVIFTQSREEGWKYDLRCRDLVALTPAAARRLLSFFADHRSFARDVVWTGGPADPVMYALREQDWEFTRSWTWMQRIVDVRSALQARGYPLGISTELHLAVTDDVLGWNDGRFVLEVSDGRGTAKKGGRGRVRIDVRGLAALYTGFQSAEHLRSTGYVDGSDRDVALATAVFAGPSPWLPDFF